MPVFEISGRRPVIGEGTWIAPDAAVIGDVRIGKNCYVGFGAIIRGDFGTIIIGEETAVEEGVIIHTPDWALIGNGVLIGHMAMIHGARIDDCSLIGMQSMICDNAHIEEWAITAEQSLVLKGQIVPSGDIFGGSPARKIGTVEQRHREMIMFGRKVYVNLTHQYRESFREIG